VETDEHESGGDLLDSRPHGGVRDRERHPVSAGDRHHLVAQVLGMA
jgi:hypothetical protein